ncbi:MAG: PP2C family protein-serine/threonine phosphatase [Pyrinomonadaceae bacterium]
MVETSQFISGAVSDRGLSEKRPHNEDSYLELRQHGVFAVADGVGGAQAGDVASQMAVEILGEAFVNISPEADPAETMKIAVDRANNAIFRMAHDLPQLASMATTIVALHVNGDVATIGHVGDSRLYRVDESGQIFRETADHSVVEEEVRAGRMTAEQAVNHPSRNIISRALGAEETVEIELKTTIVAPSTTYLLCSDGITRHIEDWEIASLLSSDTEPAEICRQMKEICYGRGAEDNLTAVIVRSPGEKKGNQANGNSLSDNPEMEQVTIAAARPPFDKVADTDDAILELNEFETPANEFQAQPEQELEQESLPQENRDLSDIEPEEISISQTVSNKAVPAQANITESRPSVYFQPENMAEEPEYGSGYSKKVLSALALVIAGLLGFGLNYFLMQTPAVLAPEPPPALTEMKSNNTALTAFEEGRRQVDSDPGAYIRATSNPQEAEDYFLLARAFLLTGKYWDAKRFYGLAKDRLGEVEESNAKTLEAEIAMALAIIESPSATEIFAKQIPTAREPGAAMPNRNAVTNFNANIPANTNLRIR